MLILGRDGAEVWRKSWAVEARRCPGEAKGGREDGSGARGGSGLRREATDTMAVKTRWRVSRKVGPVRLRVRGGLRRGETRLDGWRVAAWYQGRADRRRPGLRGQEALAAGSERAKTTNSPLQPATTKRMRVDRELAGAGSRGLAKEPDKVRLSARRRYGAKGGHRDVVPASRAFRWIFSTRFLCPGGQGIERRGGMVVFGHPTALWTGG